MKSLETIYNEMLETFGQASGYIPHNSCDLSARLYAAAAQIQALYHQANWTLEQSFPQTAQGIYLEQHAALRGLQRSTAAPATGLIRFGASNALIDLTIEAGTICMTKTGIRFATIEDGTLTAGNSYVDIPAQAVAAGTAGNVAAGTITIMAAIPTGIHACVNPDAFSGGIDEESDEALRARLLDTFKRLPNGANTAYYEQTALSCPGVAAAIAVGRPRGVGSVDVYIATEQGLPDVELLETIRTYLQERREISVDLQVLSPTPKTVDISVAVLPAPHVTFEAARAQVGDALHSAFSGSLLGKGVTMVCLGDILYHLDGVRNYRILSPCEDIPASPTVLPTLGNVTITEWEA